MSRSSRKAKRNLGGTEAEAVTSFFGEPQLTEARTNIVMIERVLLAVIRSEVERLRADTNELTRFFSHFYDPIAGEEERARFVANFQAQPPVTVLGYPRTTAQFPCFAVVLESENESQNVLDDYVGESLPGEDVDEAAEYRGAIFDHTYSVYVFAEHPDVVAYLYQFVKLVLFGAKPFLVQAGLIDPHFSGGELSPEEMYLPENMFARVFRITASALVTVPRLLDPDPVRVRLAGIFMNDIVVDGIRGGVTPYAASEDDDDGT
jgi:hypothetical protein